MYTMTFIFTASYFLRSLFLLSQIWLGDACEDGDVTQAFANDLMFLILLPVSDLIPIIVVLYYHYKTMRNVAPYVPPQNDKKKSQHDRLYSLDELETESSTSLSSSPSHSSSDKLLRQYESMISSKSRFSSS